MNKAAEIQKKVEKAVEETKDDEKPKHDEES